MFRYCLLSLFDEHSLTQYLCVFCVFRLMEDCSWMGESGTGLVYLTEGNDKTRKEIHKSLALLKTWITCGDVYIGTPQKHTQKNNNRKAEQWCNPNKKNEMTKQETQKVKNNDSYDS